MKRLIRGWTLFKEYAFWYVTKQKDKKKKRKKEKKEKKIHSCNFSCMHFLYKNVLQQCNLMYKTNRLRNHLLDQVF